MVDRPELKQTKAALQKMIAEVEGHWISIREAFGGLQRSSQLWGELQKLEVGSPERKAKYSKFSEELQKVHDRRVQLLPKLTPLISKARETLRECDFWFLEEEGQIERLEQLHESWRSDPDWDQLVIVRRFIAGLKKLLSDTYSKLPSETGNSDKAEERVADPNQSAVSVAPSASRNQASATPHRAKIPLQRKLAALEAKFKGTKNKELAKTLYNLPYPSGEKQRSVTTHLRSFVKHHPKEVYERAKDKSQFLEWLKDKYPTFRQYCQQRTSSQD